MPRPLSRGPASAYLRSSSVLRPRSALLDCCSSLVHLLPVLFLLPSVRTLVLLPPA